MTPTETLQALAQVLQTVKPDWCAVFREVEADTRANYFHWISPATRNSEEIYPRFWDGNSPQLLHDLLDLLRKDCGMTGYAVRYDGGVVGFRPYFGDDPTPLEEATKWDVTDTLAVALAVISVLTPKEGEGA